MSMLGDTAGWMFYTPGIYGEFLRNRDGGRPLLVQGGGMSAGAVEDIYYYVSWGAGRGSSILTVGSIHRCLQR